MEFTVLKIEKGVVGMPSNAVRTVTGLFACCEAGHYYTYTWGNEQEKECPQCATLESFVIEARRLSALIDEWQAKAFALDRLEQYAGAINYGGKPLRWDGRTRGSLLRAIDESDREFREMDRKVKTSRGNAMNFDEQVGAAGADSVPEEPEQQ